MNLIKATGILQYITFVYFLLYTLFIFTGELGGFFHPLTPEVIGISSLYILFVIGFLFSWVSRITTGTIFLIWNIGMWTVELYFVKHGGFGIVSGLPLIVLGVFFILEGIGKNRGIPMTSDEKWRIALRLLATIYTLLYASVVIHDVIKNPGIDFFSAKAIIAFSLFLIYCIGFIYSWKKEYVAGTIFILWYCGVLIFFSAFPVSWIKGPWNMAGVVVLIQGILYLSKKQNIQKDEQNTSIKRNKLKTILIISCSASFLFMLIYPGFRYIHERNKYKAAQKHESVTEADAVVIGTQIWMAKNLDVTNYNDGSEIQNITGKIRWRKLKTGAFCWIKNNIKNKNTYGALYNWYAVSTGKLCPRGWHVPTDAEWAALTKYLIENGYNYDGTTAKNKIAKSLAATTYWKQDSKEGVVGNIDYPAYRNKTGYTGFPAGFRNNRGYFGFFQLGGSWWSSTEADTLNAWNHSIVAWNINLQRWKGKKIEGHSVRCIRD